MSEGAEPAPQAHDAARIIVRMSGAGPPVLFLHGYPTSGRLWDLVVDRLEARFTCFAIDLPGFGGSPPLPGPPDPELIAREIEALRVDLGLPAWSLVGHDAGAVVAIHYTARFAGRVERLALLSPPIFPELRPPWFFGLVRKRGIGEILAPLVIFALWRGGGLRSRIERPDPALERILEDFRRPFRGRSGARRLLELVRWGDPQEILARTASLLPRIEVPTLILQGRRDGAVPPAFATRAADLIPGARAVFLDAGHFLPLDAPEALGEELGAFLEGLRRTPAS